MNSDAEKLAQLRKIYGPSVENWLSKNRPEKDEKKYEAFIKFQQMFSGQLKPSKKYRVDSLEMILKKIFPKADYIILSDSESDDNNSDSKLKEIVIKNEATINDEISKSLQHEIIIVDSVDNGPLEALVGKKTEEESSIVQTKMKARRPSICIPSLAEYSIKTQKLPPSSAYAKKSTAHKPALSINYKEAKPIIKTPYDPKEEAIKLNNIKEKIYCKQFLKIDEKKILKDECIKESKIISLAASSSETKFPKKSPFKMRKRALSVNCKAIELSESDDEFIKIPILKTCRPIRRSWRQV